MIVQGSWFLLALILVVIFEVIYIILDSKDHFIYFRDFMDAFILLTFILCAYFVYQYIKARRYVPARVSTLIADDLAQKRQKEETN